MKDEWFVIWVATGQETELLPRIARIPRVMEAFSPRLPLWERRHGEWQLNERYAFPGYIFVRCRMDSEIYYAVRELPGVLGWLGRDTLWPTTVQKEEMEAVLALHRGIAPEKVLADIRANRRGRRAYGSITLQGVQYRIPYNIYQETDKQAESPTGDASPAEG